MVFVKGKKGVKNFMKGPSLRQQKAISILMTKGGSVGAALKEAGYAHGSVRNPQVITSSDTWKEAAEPYLVRLTALREKILGEMERKDLGMERFKTLSESLQRTNHDVQLLSGGRTENVGVSGLADELGALIKELRNDNNR